MTPEERAQKLFDEEICLPGFYISKLEVAVVIREALHEERLEIAEMIRQANQLKPGQNMISVKTNDDLARMVLERSNPPESKRDCEDCAHRPFMQSSRATCNSCHGNARWSPK